MAAVSQNLSQTYTELLLTGNRTECRAIIERALTAKLAPATLLNGLVWPVMESLQRLYRDDNITITQLNLATRLNRSLTDQLCAKLERAESNGKKVLIFCGNDEPEELGGQIAADLFESDGWTVRFAGGGVPEDEALKLIGDFRPDLLVMFATLPTNVPAVRKLIDYLRDVNSCPDMQIMCCGGIYKRAEGLAEEIGADLYAPDAEEAVAMAKNDTARRATVDQQTVGRMRRIEKAAQRKASTGPKQTATSEVEAA